MPAKKAATKKAGVKAKTTRKRRGPTEPRGPEAKESALALDDPAIGELIQRIEGAKGSVLAAYRDPYASTPLVLASLPVGAVEAPPFQPDPSPTPAARPPRPIRYS